ncbi:disulfide bond formation protein B [Steroidobacter sp. S1-65]|uniref:Disulfide bond formation protein B n=1 Tax=Steroidobacter gossypii TaxID=2805490 RepID=A0ABS1WVQ2_9GAMM|nr:disulfide bond formation protein B [Steroidobacter gossypii]MBM0105052.1 disulfide bond formation protein B [Steroidobacter gossypii]
MNRRAGNALGFVACAALMGYALYAEHVLGLAPCPLCIFQRVAVIVVGVLFLIAALHNPSGKGSIGYGVLIDLAALIGVGISARHIWIQAQPPGTVAACGADLDYLLDILPVTEVVNKVLTGSGECGKVDWTLLGLSMPWWVLISLALLSAWAVIVNIAARPR